MGVMRLGPDGKWHSADPLGYDESAIDVEVYRAGTDRHPGQLSWRAYIGPRDVACGVARSQFRLKVRLTWLALRHLKAVRIL
jgi:hypothetical protein